MTDITLNWNRKDPKYNESVRAVDFNEKMPEVAKQLKDANGSWVDGKTFTEGNWTYRAKGWPKDAPTMWFVERFTPKPAGTGSGNTSRMSKEEWAKKDAERNARIDKAHQENLEVQRRIAAAQENIAETMTAILTELRTISKHVELVGFK